MYATALTRPPRPSTQSMSVISTEDEGDGAVGHNGGTAPPSVQEAQDPQSTTSVMVAPGPKFQRYARHRGQRFLSAPRPTACTSKPGYLKE